MGHPFRLQSCEGKVKGEYRKARGGKLPSFRIWLTSRVLKVRTFPNKPVSFSKFGQRKGKLGERRGEVQM